MSIFDKNKLVSALQTVEHATEVLEALKAGILEKESPPEVFLNHAGGDYAAAAQRLAYHWEERAAVIGANYLKPLRECLTDQHHKWLAMDVSSVLPGTDKEGRRVFFVSSYKGRERLSLCRFVSMHKLMMEHHREPTHKGATLLRIVDPEAPFDLKWAQNSEHVLQKCFPIEIDHIRSLCAGRKSYIRKTLMPMVNHGMGKELNQRCKWHVDTELTKMQGHLSDILEAHQLPGWLGGTWKSQDETQHQHEASSSTPDKLFASVAEAFEDVADADLEKEMRGALVQLTDDSTPEEDQETRLVEIADTIRASRIAKRHEMFGLEVSVELVFSVASAILEELPGPRLANLLRDDLSDEILRDLWASSVGGGIVVSSSTPATSLDSSGSTESGENSVQAMVPISRKDRPEPQETKVDELHAKFRSALKLLQLMQEEEYSTENPLEDKDDVAFVCELVGLPFSYQCKIDASQVESNLDKLADKVALNVGGTPDIPDWLVNGVTAEVVPVS